MKNNPVWCSFNGGVEHILWLVKHSGFSKEDIKEKILKLLQKGHDPLIIYNFVEKLKLKGFDTKKLGALRRMTINPLPKFFP